MRGSERSGCSRAISKFLTGLLPPAADVRHIGATAIPGCLTKGNLDIVVRVPIDQFSDTDAVLASHLAPNEGFIRSKPHLGIQLAD
jgi:GrpB-like predicted nucleotidyltransferase (UPF0157 family)